MKQEFTAVLLVAFIGNGEVELIFPSAAMARIRR
jgi:hypothetical protein